MADLKRIEAWQLGRGNGTEFKGTLQVASTSNVGLNQYHPDSLVESARDEAAAVSTSSHEWWSL